MTTTAKRRQVLLSLGTGSVAIAAAMPAIAFTPQDPHGEWAEAFFEGLRALDEMANGDDYDDDILDAIYEIGDKVLDTPATTLEGNYHRLRIVDHWMDDGDIARDAIRSVMAFMRGSF
ncbi:MAG: hypothetical protein AAFY56_04330 [Pseudomonadota bacterium]